MLHFYLFLFLFIYLLLLHFFLISLAFVSMSVCLPARQTDRQTDGSDRLLSALHSAPHRPAAAPARRSRVRPPGERPQLKRRARSLRSGKTSASISLRLSPEARAGAIPQEMRELRASFIMSLVLVGGGGWQAGPACAHKHGGTAAFPDGPAAASPPARPAHHHPLLKACFCSWRHARGERSPPC